MRSFRMENCVILLCLALVGSWTPLGLSAEVNKSPDFCKLMPEMGLEPVCTAYIPQFFFNSTSQKCEEFIYGGCGGNENRFDSKKKCLETCHPHPIHEVKSDHLAEACVLAGSRQNWDQACNLPPDAGPCMGYFPSYFYNATSASCEIFIYGGCGGNTNRFKHLTSCQMYCRVPVLKSNETEVCNLPPETGPCKARFHKLFYNSHSQRCEPFIYGGCDGNANRFDSAEECQDMCQSGDSDLMTPLAVPEKATLRSLDVCVLPPEIGPCRMNIPRFFYNPTSKKCEPFTYGGCEGNKNRFVSQRECHLWCPNRSPQIEPTEKPGSVKDVCLLPSDSGPCEAFMPRFYYNHQTQKCTEFVYGGCRGNKNNFIDEEQCNKMCKKD